MFIYVQGTILGTLSENICSYRNAEQMKAFWKLSGISEKSENRGKCVHVFFVAYNVMSHGFFRHVYGKFSPGISCLQF